MMNELTSSLHEGHEALSTNDLDGTIHGALILDSLSRCHHHTTTNGVNGVGDQTRCNGHHWKKLNFE